MEKEDKIYLKLLGARISERREALKYGKEEFAKKVGLTRMHLYRIEDGQHAVAITILKKIAKELKMPLGELCDF